MMSKDICNREMTDLTVDFDFHRPAAAAANMRYKDARLLYMMGLASWRAHYGTPLVDARHDFVPQDVELSRYAAAQE